MSDCKCNCKDRNKFIQEQQKLQEQEQQKLEERERQINETIRRSVR